MPLKHQIATCAKTLAVLEIDVTAHFTMHICSHNASNIKIKIKKKRKNKLVMAGMRLEPF